MHAVIHTIFSVTAGLPNRGRDGLPKTLTTGGTQRQ